MKNIREKIKVKGLKRDNSFANNIANAKNVVCLFI